MAVASEAGLEIRGSRRNSRRCCLPNDKGLKEKIIFVILKKKCWATLRFSWGKIGSIHYTPQMTSRWTANMNVK